jgi:spore maturation protein CgeB
MKLFKRKKQLDSKSKHIAVMYLTNAKYRLEKELASKRFGESEIFTARHDIRCLENAISYLEEN